MRDFEAIHTPRARTRKKERRAGEPKIEEGSWRVRTEHVKRFLRLVDQC